MWPSEARTARLTHLVQPQEGERGDDGGGMKIQNELSVQSSSWPNLGSFYLTRMYL
jgi:hypothetical protein